VTTQLPNLIGPLTEPISGDEYVRVVLVQRAQAWSDAQARTVRPWKVRPGFPPLLEWFITAEDEQFVQLPEPTPASEQLPARERKPRVYRSAVSLREERDGLLARMEQVAGRSDLGDVAATNLSPSCRSRAARTAGRRRFEQMDRDLATYAGLRRRVDALAGRIARAEARESGSEAGVQ
jgi:hypothetical protein